MNEWHSLKWITKFFLELMEFMIVLDWLSWSNIIVTVLICGDEAGDSFFKKALCLLFNQYLYSYQWSRAVGIDWKNTYRQWEWGSSTGLLGLLSVSSTICVRLGVKPLILHLRTEVQDAPWSAPARSASQVSHWMETLGQTQDLLERSYLTITLHYIADYWFGNVQGFPRNLGDCGQ